VDTFHLLEEKYVWIETFSGTRPDKKRNSRLFLSYVSRARYRNELKRLVPERGQTKSYNLVSPRMGPTNGLSYTETVSKTSQADDTGATLFTIAGGEELGAGGRKVQRKDSRSTTTTSQRFRLPRLKIGSDKVEREAGGQSTKSLSLYSWKKRDYTLMLRGGKRHQSLSM